MSGSILGILLINYAFKRQSNKLKPFTIVNIILNICDICNILFTLRWLPNIQRDELITLGSYELKKV